MAPVPLDQVVPFPQISPQCTPAALRSALQLIFAQVPADLWLVGGTALAGYYARHRRSDDLDFFAKDAHVLEAATAAVRALAQHGATLQNERRFPAYFHADVRFQQHAFTVDVVLDAHLHAVGHAQRARDGNWVADLPTLFAMKCATLVSRCSEKDLFDLAWFFKRQGRIDIADVLKEGTLFDGGLQVESLLLSIHGATLRREACGFVLTGARGQAAAFRTVTQLRQRLLRALLQYEASAPPSALAQLLRKRLQHDRPE